MCCYQSYNFNKDLNFEKRFHRTKITKLNNEKSGMVGKTDTLRKFFTTQFVSGTLDDHCANLVTVKVIASVATQTLGDIFNIFLTKFY